MGVRRAYPARKHKAICAGILLLHIMAAEVNTLSMLNLEWKVKSLMLSRFRVKYTLAQCSYCTDICPRYQNTAIQV